MSAAAALLVVAYALAAAPSDERAVVDVIAFTEQGERAARVPVVVTGASRTETDASGRVTVDVAVGAVVVAVGAPGGIALPALTVGAGEAVALVVTVDGAGRVVAVDGAPGGPGDAAPEHAPVATGLDAPAPLASTRVIGVHVVDELSGAPLASVRIFAAGVGFVGATDDAGRATLTLPAADVQVSFVHSRSSPRVMLVDAAAATGAILEIALLPAATDLSELTVRAPRIEGGLREAVAERRQQQQVVDVIGAEQMKRSGDGDAAGALKRAAGLTVIGGRYVVVRGLGERYSTTLLDGGVLPSPEPERRVVPLDMFPAGILSSVMVQKSWSPDLPGEFGGGAVQLRTRRIPERRFVDVSLGGAFGLGPASTLSQAPMYRGGALDWLGFDDGTRALPAPLRAASSDRVLGEKSALNADGYTPVELERFGESLSDVYTAQAQPLPPSASLGVTAGDRWSFSDFDVGALASLSWSQDWARSLVERHSYAVGAGGALMPVEDGVVDATDRNVALGGLLGLGLELDGHALQSTTFLQRMSDDEVRVLDGFDLDANTDIRATRLRWVERTLLAQRLSGEHALPLSLVGDGAAGAFSVLSWRYAFALASRDEPDQRETRYDRDPSADVFLLSDRPEGNQRLFSTLGEQSHDAELAWRTPLPSLFSHADGADAGDAALLHVGLAASAKLRAVDTRRYTLQQSGPASSSPELRRRRAEEIFTPDHIGADGFQLAESTRKTDNYSGQALVGGAFAVATLPLPWKWTLSGGARVEGAHIGVETFELFNAAATPVEARLATLDVLPALSATWAFRDDMQLRVAGALTVARPELRELSPAVFTDVTAGRSRFGNPALQPTSIAHGDVRWEWYLSSTDALSVAAFGKSFTSPVERTITAGADQSVTYENAASAMNIGVEVEARVGVPAAWLGGVDGAYVGGNGALIWSTVQLPEDGIQTSRERPLEGQSPWVLNAEVGWAGDVSDPSGGGGGGGGGDGGDDGGDDDVTITALYNVFGARIRDVGVLGAPDVYEQPFHQLDVVAGWRLPWRPSWLGSLALQAKGQNLLDGETLLTQGGEVMERSKRGPAFSLSLSAGF